MLDCKFLACPPGGATQEAKGGAQEFAFVAGTAGGSEAEYVLRDPALELALWRKKPSWHMETPSEKGPLGSVLSLLLKLFEENQVEPICSGSFQIIILTHLLLHSSRSQLLRPEKRQAAESRGKQESMGKPTDV